MTQTSSSCSCIYFEMTAKFREHFCHISNVTLQQDLHKHLPPRNTREGEGFLLTTKVVRNPICFLHEIPIPSMYGIFNYITFTININHENVW